MENIEIEEIGNLMARMRENILTAYEIAGNLRDIFSSLPTDQQDEFKKPCNKIRGFLYEAEDQERILRGSVNTKL